MSTKQESSLVERLEAICPETMTAEWTGPLKSPAEDAAFLAGARAMKAAALRATPTPEDVVSAVRAYRAIVPQGRPVPEEQPTGEGECDMGVGCKEAGVCYAAAHGHPNRCSLAAPPPPQDTTGEGEWVMVPREPTLDMIGAARDCADCIGDIYRAMLDAAPPPPLRDAGAVATLLASDPYEDSLDAQGPWMHMHDWKRLRELPAGTKLYTHPAPAQVDEAAAQLRGLIAEIDPPKKPATGEIKLIADQLRHTLAALAAAAKEVGRG